MAQRGLIAALLSASLIGLAGCDLLPSKPTPPPVPRPDAPVKPAIKSQSEISRQMALHLAKLQADLYMQGLLRVDGGGPDVPFSRRNLVDNFIRIAMFDEYSSNGSTLVARETESRLRRWEQPIRMQIEFGASIPQAQRNKDRASIRAYVKRLSRLTNVPISITDHQPNFHVLILNEDERLAAGPRLQEIAPGISPASTRTVTHLQRSTLCLVFAYSSSANSSAYAKAVAVIRGEHPDLLRQSCIHEELAQGMGLANDSAAARPSIFNDDEEFGLLTHHDSLLLQMLYDPRLKLGMTAKQARPIAKKIADELMGATI